MSGKYKKRIVKPYRLRFIKYSRIVELVPDVGARHYTESLTWAGLVRSKASREKEITATKKAVRRPFFLEDVWLLFNEGLCSTIGPSHLKTGLGDLVHQPFLDF